MADDALARAGLFFDELNKIRVLKPQAGQNSSELKDECQGFVHSKAVPSTLTDYWVPIDTKILFPYSPYRNNAIPTTG